MQAELYNKPNCVPSTYALVSFRVRKERWGGRAKYQMMVMKKKKETLP